jgi:hypothetical protein
VIPPDVICCSCFEILLFTFNAFSRIPKVILQRISAVLRRIIKRSLSLVFEARMPLCVMMSSRGSATHELRSATRRPSVLAGRKSSAPLPIIGTVLSGVIVNTKHQQQVVASAKRAHQALRAAARMVRGRSTETAAPTAHLIFLGDQDP